MRIYCDKWTIIRIIDYFNNRLLSINRLIVAALIIAPLKTHLEVVIDAIECVIVRVTGNPTDAVAICIRVVHTVPVSVAADAVNHRINFAHQNFRPLLTALKKVFCVRIVVALGVFYCIDPDWLRTGCKPRPLPVWPVLNKYECDIGQGGTTSRLPNNAVRFTVTMSCITCHRLCLSS